MTGVVENGLFGGVDKFLGLDGAGGLSSVDSG